MNSEKYDDAWYHERIVQLTLNLYKCEDVNRDGVDNVIKMFNEFITESTLKNIKYILTIMEPAIPSVLMRENKNLVGFIYLYPLYHLTYEPN